MEKISKEREAFNLIKRAIDLGVQKGNFGSIEETKAVFDSLSVLHNMVEESLKQQEPQAQVHELSSK